MTRKTIFVIITNPTGSIVSVSSTVDFPFAAPYVVVLFDPFEKVRSAKIDRLASPSNPPEMQTDLFS